MQQLKYWGCELGDHMYNDCTHKGDRLRTMHNNQEEIIVYDNKYTSYMLMHKYIKLVIIIKYNNIKMILN